MNKSIRFIINNREVTTHESAGTPSLDFIRGSLNLKGTKEGCREGECGACTVLLGSWEKQSLRYKAVTSCLLPLGELDGKHIVTIEGLNGPDLNPVQQALVDQGASQCGFCTPGFVVSLTAFFFTSPRLDYQDARDALDGNICRCTGYASIERAVEKLSTFYASRLDAGKDRISQLADWTVVPEYFRAIPGRLKAWSKEITEQSTERNKKKLIVAGGTDVYIQKPEELIDADLDFISRYSSLSVIEKKGNLISVGAGVTAEELKGSALLGGLIPDMKNYMNLVSSTILRNRATLAGNIVNASPIGDLTVFFLALESRVKLVNGNKSRLVPLEEFFLGYKQIEMKQGEMVHSVEFPLPPQRFMFHFEKVARRKHLDIASVNSAISIVLDQDRIKSARLAAGGVNPIPSYLKETAALLTGKKVSPALVIEAGKLLQREVAPISDVRGSAEYKRLLLQKLVYAHFVRLFPEIIRFEDLL